MSAKSASAKTTAFCSICRKKKLLTELTIIPRQIWKPLRFCVGCLEQRRQLGVVSPPEPEAKPAPRPSQLGTCRVLARRRWDDVPLLALWDL